MTWNKKECALCKKEGEIETYWSSALQEYRMRVKCNNPECPGNRL